MFDSGNLEERAPFWKCFWMELLDKWTCTSNFSNVNSWEQNLYAIRWNKNNLADFDNFFFLYTEDPVDSLRYKIEGKHSIFVGFLKE